jgi:hypothetical protein
MEWSGTGTTEGMSGDSPAEPGVGLSPRRERRWGWIGGAVGALVGVGGFLIAVVVQNEAIADLAGSPYPPLFERREMMALDYWFVAVLLAGLGFLAASLVAIRSGRYPRTDGFGAALVGSILCALGGFVFFLRLVAVLES